MTEESFLFCFKHRKLNQKNIFNKKIILQTKINYFIKSIYFDLVLLLDERGVLGRQS